MKLREQFEKETGTPWTNKQGEPDIDYVEWLEKDNKMLLDFIDSQIKSRVNCDACKEKWAEIGREIFTERRKRNDTKRTI